MSMRQDVVTKSVFEKWIERAVGAVYRPVPPQLLRTKNKDAFIAQLEVLDHGKGGEGLAETNAVARMHPLT